MWNPLRSVFFGQTAASRILPAPGRPLQGSPASPRFVPSVVLRNCRSFRRRILSGLSKGFMQALPERHNELHPSQPRALPRPLRWDPSPSAAPAFTRLRFFAENRRFWACRKHTVIYSTLLGLRAPIVDNRNEAVFTFSPHSTEGPPPLRREKSGIMHQRIHNFSY